MNFFYDSLGYPGIDSYSEEDNILVDFLLTDIQSDIYFIDEIEEIILLIMKGETNKWEGNLNTYSITIHQDKVLIANEYNESINQIYDINKFFQTIKEWKIFIQNNSKNL